MYAEYKEKIEKIQKFVPKERIFFAEYSLICYIVHIMEREQKNLNSPSTASLPAVPIEAPDGNEEPEPRRAGKRQGKPQ